MWQQFYQGSFLSTQIEMIRLDDLVPASHIYREFMRIWNFVGVERQLKSLEKNNPHKGYGLPRWFRCLLLQFLEDLSDHELERFMQENNAAKLFCGFSLAEMIPDHTVFTRVRDCIGTHKLSKIFATLCDQLKAQGYMNEVFTFVDATSLIAKATLWKERDKAIKAKYEKLNNEVLPKVAHDKQAGIGCKGKDKYWHGYKEPVGADMQNSLINKIACTPANVTDAKGFKPVCPSQGAAYADKAYCVLPAKRSAKMKGCHWVAIKKNNMHDKNKELDRWLSSIRAPYEKIFSRCNKRVRYVGLCKNQFALFMHAITFNLKRLTVLEPTSVVWT